MDHKIYKILLVEDDHSLGYLLSEYLKMKGFEISWAKDAQQALEWMPRAIFDLAILDVMMPGMDGFTLASHLKEACPELPFLFLTARSMKIDVLRGFAAGAVDYLKKPIDEEELVTRIEALLKRLDRTIESDGQSEVSLGNYRFNYLNQELIYGKDTLRLTSREAGLLHILTANRNTLCTHKVILVRLWGKNDYFNRKSLNVFVTHLRKYLDKDPNIKIENIHGRGFILRDSSGTSPAT